MNSLFENQAPRPLADRLRPSLFFPLPPKSGGEGRVRGVLDPVCIAPASPSPFLTRRVLSLSPRGAERASAGTCLQARR